MLFIHQIPTQHKLLQWYIYGSTIPEAEPPIFLFAYTKNTFAARIQRKSFQCISVTQSRSTIRKTAPVVDNFFFNGGFVLSVKNTVYCRVYYSFSVNCVKFIDCRYLSISYLSISQNILKGLC